MMSKSDGYTLVFSCLVVSVFGCHSNNGFLTQEVNYASEENEHYIANCTETGAKKHK